MRAVLLSISPKWCELIASGIKTVDVRKTKPKLETPFKVYIYCTADDDNITGLLTKSNNGEIYIASRRYCQALENIGNKTLNRKVIGEFVCDKIYEIGVNSDDFNRWWHETVHEECDEKQMCLTWDEVDDYLGHSHGYGWHMSDLIVYEEPLELDWFRRPISCDRGDCFGCNKCEIKKSPNSWCYVNELYNSSDIVRTMSTLKGVKRKVVSGNDL